MRSLLEVLIDQWKIDVGIAVLSKLSDGRRDVPVIHMASRNLFLQNGDESHAIDYFEKAIKASSVKANYAALEIATRNHLDALRKQ